MNQQIGKPGLFIGMDWADQKHDIYVIDRNGKGFHQQLEHSAENIEAWVGDMLRLAGGQPIAIMLEQSRGALIYALMFREDVLLYPINPTRLARYRQSYPGGGKDDPTDAMYLARMLCERFTTLKAWQPDDEQTRLIANLSQQRRKIVNGQTKLRQQLKALLKSCFPVVLELFGKQHQLPLLLSVLCRWPDPRELRRADRRLIRRVLKDHGIRNEQQQKEIIERIRSAQLLPRDNALITPSAMAAKLLAKQIQEAQQTIEDFNAAITRSYEPTSRRAPVHESTWCRRRPGSTPALRVRLPA